MTHTVQTKDFLCLKSRAKYPDKGRILSVRNTVIYDFICLLVVVVSCDIVEDSGSTCADD